MKHEKEKVQELCHVLGTIMDKQAALIAEMLEVLKQVNEKTGDLLHNVYPDMLREVRLVIAKAEGHAAD